MQRSNSWHPAYGAGRTQPGDYPTSERTGPKDRCREVLQRSSSWHPAYGAGPTQPGDCPTSERDDRSLGRTLRVRFPERDEQIRRLPPRHRRPVQGRHVHAQGLAHAEARRRLQFVRAPLRGDAARRHLLREDREVPRRRRRAPARDGRRARLVAGLAASNVVAGPPWGAGRGTAAGATWIFRGGGDATTPRLPR